MSPNVAPRPGRRKLMQSLPLDGQAIIKLTQAGLNWLKTNQQTVNALNVFPVPDGDTGTNMVLTMQSAVKEVEGSTENNAGKVMHAIAHGALMGARGNSGVILSQLWRGFARAMDETPLLDGPGLAQAFAEARDTAYKGVVRPVEGTILTVAKDVAAAAEEALKESDSPLHIIEKAVDAAEVSVENTPELLPILKEAGVVDSGGLGYFFLLEGMLRWIDGYTLQVATTTVQPLSVLNLEHSLEAVEEGQDYEVVVDFEPESALNLEKFYAALEEMGTSIQVGEGEDLYRMHIHVPIENLHQPFDYVMTLGTVTNVAYENLIAQMEKIERERGGPKLELAPVEPGQIAVVAVAPGPGIARIFATLGVAAIVEGGQTMNPSTQQILAAFEDLPASQVVILPNNKNILMAAEAVTEVTVKEVAVIPSRTVPQGLSAMLRLMPEGQFETVVKEMNAALDEVETGEVTTAIRNVEIDGVAVQEGQIIALHNGKLILSSPNLEEACLGFLDKIEAAQYELITLFYGANITQDEVNKIAAAIQDAYPEQEIEIQEGGQPHYQFIFSVE